MTLQEPITQQLGFTFEAQQSARRVWPVRDLVAEIREMVEQQYPDVWVEGEISNFRAAPSGHLYFTLKDADAQLPAVLFRRQALLLRFRPADGLRVLVRGKVSIYEQRGQMQLVAESMEPVGVGSLLLAFEQLKERLRAEGLFDNARKRQLPAFPRTVGIITSPTGAVIRDFLNIVSRRHAGLDVLLYPVSVQGDSAPAEIEAAVEALNASGLVDLLVLARGGGSLEDLAAFNSERVARAIAASHLPVVSAIGHETDFTIADFVADLRAPTPSAAAELITEAQHKIADYLENQSSRLIRAIRFQLIQARQRVDMLPISRSESRVGLLFSRLSQRLDDLTFRLDTRVGARLRQLQHCVDSSAAGVSRHDPRQMLASTRARLTLLQTRMERAMEHALQAAGSAASSLAIRLNALSPLAVLDRGYALVLDTNGSVIHSTAQLSPGDRVTTHVFDGAFVSRVESASSDHPSSTKRNRS